MTVRTQMVQLDSLTLDCGENLLQVDVAYETYGELAASRDNAILILHAFSGDAHAAGAAEEDGKAGWWDNMIGPGKAFDTNHYFVICSNVLGGCRGTTGPRTTDPATGCPYGAHFPFVTIADMTRLQKRLIEHLGIEKLLAVAGASMGGLQALQWVIDYPDMVVAAIPIAATYRHSAQQIAFNEVGRQSIMADPDWKNGDYYDGPAPVRGLAVARMVAHITYMSDDSMHTKFGRRRHSDTPISGQADALFEVESYLRYRGSQFVNRFDANSYLTISRAIDCYDATTGFESLGKAVSHTQARFLVISFSSDWLYPSYQSQEIVRALRSRNLDVAYVELPSSYGHDAFLIEVSEQTELIKSFLENTYKRLPKTAAEKAVKNRE